MSWIRAEEKVKNLDEIHMEASLLRSEKYSESIKNKYWIRL